MGNHYLAQNLGAAGNRRSQSSVNGRGDHHEPWNVAQDTGCPISKACLRCPLPRCLLDEPVESRRRTIESLGLNPWYLRKLFY